MKAYTNTQKIQEKVQKVTTAVSATTLNDFKNSVLIVSVVANLFILTTMLVIQASPSYALSLVHLG